MDKFTQARAELAMLENCGPESLQIQGECWVYWMCRDAATQFSQTVDAFVSWDLMVMVARYLADGQMVVNG